MKKNLIAWAIILCLVSMVAYANTTYYNITLPTVGGSQNTWGTTLNNAFGTVDTSIWDASGGTTIGVNAPSAGSSNITLTNPINNYQALGFTTTGKHVALPPMNATFSPILGGEIIFSNVGSNPYAITAADGSTSIVSALNAGQSVTISPLTDSTTNGTFQTFGPYLTSVSGNVSLGTSVSSTNPANGSAANTGLYTTSTSNVGVSILGTSVGLWNASGYNGAIGATTSNTGAFTTITGTNASLSGTTTTANLHVTGTCTGCGTGGIVDVSYQSFCASGCTHTSGTYTPTSGTKFIIARMTGGGGGGGGVNTAGNSGAGGGGAGGYLEALLTAAQVGTPTITIGAAGAAGANTGGNGGTGGTTSVGSLLSCTGGSGGVGSTGIGVVSGGAAGACTVTTGTSSGINQPNPGSPGFGDSNQISVGGYGGSNPLGQGGVANFVYSGNATVGFAATGYGAGGGGGANQAGTAETGGAGTAGEVVFEEYQ